MTDTGPARDGEPVLGPEAAACYRWLVASGGERPLADVVDGEACEALRRMGLVTVEDGVVRSQQPRRALDAEVAQLEAKRQGLLDLGDQLTAVWDEHHRDPGFEVLVGHEATGVFADLLDQAHVSVDGLLVDMSPPDGDPETVPNQPDAMARGVAVRAIYEANLLGNPAGIAAIRDSVRLGEVARVMPSVPLSCLVVDGSLIAFIPPYDDYDSRELFLTRHPGTVRAMKAMFEEFWALAIEVAPSAWEESNDSEAAESDVGDRILMLMAAGLPDRAIARELGMSQRTLGRRISDLQARLGAKSRFQLGYQGALRLRDPG